MITKIHKYTTGYNAGKTIKYITDENGNVTGKSCLKCDEMKQLNKFSPNKTGLHGHNAKCKECQSKYTSKLQVKKYANDEEYREKCIKNVSKCIKERYANDSEFREKCIKAVMKCYENTKTDYWVIYLIDNFDGKGNHYVGQTQNLPHRLQEHRYWGADTRYVLEMDTAPTQALANEYEAQYHERGYCGAKGCPKYKAMKEKYKNKKKISSDAPLKNQIIKGT